jgi:Tfp pilus assembly protein PilO
MNAATVDALKRKPVVLSAALTVLVVIIWLLAFFFPQGSKVSTLDAQEQGLQLKVAAGNAKVAHLEHTFRNKPVLSAMQAALQADVPTNTGIYDYINSLSTTAAASGVKLTSVTPQSASAASGKNSFTSVAISMAVKGTYDQLLSLVTNIYNLPRLTDINEIEISGGGPGTSRSTPLSATLSLMAFSTAKPIRITP